MMTDLYWFTKWLTHICYYQYWNFQNSLWMLRSCFRPSFKQNIYFVLTWTFKEVDYFLDESICLAWSFGKYVFYKEINDDRSFKQGESFAWWKYWCRFWDNQSTQEIENGSVLWSLKIQKGVLNFMVKLIEKLNFIINYFHI